MLRDLLYNPKSSPKMVKVVPRFRMCFKTRWTMFEKEKAHIVLARTNVVYLLVYGFDDDS